MDLEQQARLSRWGFYLSFYGSIAIFAVLVYGFQTWRLHTFAHAEAVLVDVWYEWRQLPKNRDKYLVAVAKLKFQRSHNGRTFDCEIVRDLGRPEYGFRAGQKLEVVPATGTCDRIDIIGPVETKGPVEKPKPSREHWPSYLR